MPGHVLAEAPPTARTCPPQPTSSTRPASAFHTTRRGPLLVCAKPPVSCSPGSGRQRQRQRPRWRARGMVRVRWWTRMRLRKEAEDEDELQVQQHRPRTWENSPSHAADSARSHSPQWPGAIGVLLRPPMIGPIAPIAPIAMSGGRSCSEDLNFLPAIAPNDPNTKTRSPTAESSALPPRSWRLPTTAPCGP